MFSIICQQEYKKLNYDSVSIGLVMIIKNEEKRITVTFDTVKDIVDAFIIFDTGSTDNTVDIVKNYCVQNKINLYMISGQFVDFSVSRNHVLDYADTIDVHYILMLDCNDELQHGENLRKWAILGHKESVNGFLMTQHWFSGTDTKYFNVRCVKNRQGWRYKGRVHEYIDREGEKNCLQIDDIIIYQDRTKDDDKSLKRFSRDKILLLEDYRQNPTEPRTLFYLAQTCQCLQQYDEALYYSKLRTELAGFEEEVFQSYMRCGDCLINMNADWSDILPWYIKAFAHTSRAEPLVRIGQYYILQQKWETAFMFLRQACELSYPKAILFVNADSYNYLRWHLLAVCASHIGQMDIGQFACEKALETGINKAVNLEIASFYKKIDLKKYTDPKPKISKQDFINNYINENAQSKTSKRTLEARAELLWKKVNS